MKKFILVIAVVLLSVTACSSSDKVVFYNGSGQKLAELDVEFAVSQEEQQRGLMYRKELDQDSGMIFVYNRPRILSFWMKNTYLPLDIAFVDKNNVVIDIFPMVPLSLESIRSTSEALYAIEVNAGYYAKRGITPGSRIELEIDK
jgi:uncharacterized membrane protein (UPF0127 family)